jgi:hypothetical protein
MRLIARLKCWWTGHTDMTAFDAKARTIRLVCSECQRHTRGWVIDAERPMPMREVKKRKPTGPAPWLRAIHLGKGA